MNAQKLLRFIQHPEQAQSGDLRDLEQLVADFPYFHAARMVHLKALQLTGNYRQASYLPKAAAYLPDRVVLKHWMEGPDAEGMEVVPLQFLHQTPVAPAEAEEALAPAVFVPQEVEPVVEAIAPVLEPIAIEPTPAVSQVPEVQLPAPPQQDADWDQLDPVAKAKRILERNRAIRAGMNTPVPAVETKPMPEVVVESALEPEPIPERVEPQDPPVAEEVRAAIPAEDWVDVQPVQVPVEVATAARRSFTEWLAVGSAAATPVTPTPPMEDAPVDLIPTPREPEQPAVVPSRALIDRFLDQPPVLKPKKDAPPAPVPNPVPYAGSALVTETLAQLYFGQGHLALAEEAYEILKLKYPEKSSFFAARIREIKALRKT
jgi:hypothetical protein